MLQDVYYKDEKGNKATRIQISPIGRGRMPSGCKLGQCEETRFHKVANATEVFHIRTLLERFCENHIFATQVFLQGSDELKDKGKPYKFEAIQFYKENNPVKIPACVSDSSWDYVKVKDANGGKETYLNKTDVERIVDGPLSKTVAVICFYRLQCEVLEASLAQSKFKRELIHAMENGRLRLRTVDSFQGNEADIVVLSGVRSNLDGKVGFLASRDGKKRICVSVSRAKEALIIVGDSSTLTQSSEHPLAFRRLWEAQYDAGYNLRKFSSAAELVQTGSRAATFHADVNLVSDLFS